MSRIETDYLVVGAGAVGLSFADAFRSVSDDDLVLVDRQTEPGGHWNDAYSFVHLHQPSALYGVNSMSLGSDTIDTDGCNAGGYERATGSEVRDYFRSVLADTLLPSGHVRFLGAHDYVDGHETDHELHSYESGETVSVHVRKAVVDATFLQGAIPATTPPPFDIDTGATVIPPNALPDIGPAPSGYTVIGAGKTAMDTITWLLDQGEDPGRIRWIKPRETWLLNRTWFQPRALVTQMVEGLARALEASAEADSVNDLFARLEASEQLLRVDSSVEPTMYRCATVSAPEIDTLRTVDHVVRHGRVRHVGRSSITLDEGSMPTDTQHVHVFCTAEGVPSHPPRPVFEPHRITIQAVRTCQPTFNAAFIGFLEARGGDRPAMNELCPPNPYPSRATDWIANSEISQRAQARWNDDAEVTRWLEGSRLNIGAGLRDQFGDPAMQSALTRYVTYAEPAVVNLARLRSTLTA